MVDCGFRRGYVPQPDSCNQIKQSRINNNALSSMTETDFPSTPRPPPLACSPPRPRSVKEWSGNSRASSQPAKKNWYGNYTRSQRPIPKVEPGIRPKVQMDDL